LTAEDERIPLGIYLDGDYYILTDRDAINGTFGPKLAGPLAEILQAKFRILQQGAASPSL
jgi:hypothetical protein